MSRELLILNHHEIRELLPMDECIAVVRSALMSLSQGEAHQPLRMVVRPPPLDGLMALMPSYLGGDAPAFGLKAVTVFHGNPARGRDAHQGIVLLVSVDTGQPLALFDASAITLVRTAAASAVATSILAREDSAELAIIGSGVQARAHVTAIPRVRRIRRIRIASRHPDSARALAREMAAEVEAPIEACSSVRDAVNGADIIVTATTAASPVLCREWIAPGTHINAVGSSIPTTRELDAATMKAGRLFTDRCESLLRESGDFLLAQAEGVLGPDDVRGEIGQVLVGSVQGRVSREDITIFKSLGVSVEDLAAAQHVFRVAKQRGAGTAVRF